MLALVSGCWFLAFSIGAFRPYDKPIREIRFQIEYGNSSSGCYNSSVMLDTWFYGIDL